MDGKNSFASIKVGLERLVKSDSQALISNKPIHNFDAFHCRVSLFNYILHLHFERMIEIFGFIDKAGMEKPCDFQHTCMGYVKKISSNTLHCPWTAEDS